MDIIQISLWLGKHLSLSSGHKIAHLAGNAIALAQHSNLMMAIKANQWVASGQSLDKKGLAQRAKRVMQNDVSALFDFFYFYHRVEECEQLLRFSPHFLEMLAEGRDQHRAQILIGPHMGEFDLMGLMIVKLGLPLVVLTYPNPNGTYKTQNKIREDAGMRILPISLGAFREAKRALKEGTSLVTGIDRPIEAAEEAKYLPTFFGRPARLPIFYVRMALESGAAVRVVYSIAQPDGTIFLDCSAPIAFERYANLQDEYLLNAAKVLKETEQVIIKYPDQWSMFYPIWPEVIPQLKKLK